MKRFLHHLPLAAVALVTLAALAACSGSTMLTGTDASLSSSDPSLSRSVSSQTMRINVLLASPITDSARRQIGRYGKIVDELPEINALVVQGKGSISSDLLALDDVIAANPDAERTAPPINETLVDDTLATGLSTWDLDAINVTDAGFDNRQVAQDGSGVYVAVLDTGLVNDWRSYFPEERIATEYAISFGGGGGERGNVSSQPNKWEHDTDSHGTHVTSTILGYSLTGTPVNGVAPGATVIPVKVLNQNGSGWSSVVAQGIMYVADLKAGPLGDSPVVINMSLGGPALDAIEKAAVDYAVAKGVIIVASAGNEGEAGMGYPGAYAPVISVAASGWIGEWYPAVGGAWWYALDVSETTAPGQFYITDFSSRELPGQDLDVAAPGSWIVGPYQVNSGQLSYYFLGGTSMASPHVAGVVALMAQKDSSLSAAAAEAILEGSAIPFDFSGGPITRYVYGPSGAVVPMTFGPDSAGAGLVTADAALAATP